MILVQNHQQQLSGNKFWYLIFICFCLAACSPKVKTSKAPAKEAGRKDTPVVKPEKKMTEANISLLIPFNLNAARIRSGHKAELEKSAMAIDFYQGFKMGVDSASAGGMNFRLQVLDTKDNDAQIIPMIRAGKLSGTNLIVGPVYPDGMKAITGYAIASHIPIVSPLAATHPDEFKNPNLISLVNNIDLHARKIGDYIVREADPAKVVVVLISTKKASDEMLAAPLRAYFQQGKAAKFTFKEYSSVFSMETDRIPGKEYLVIVASPEKQFVVATLDKLVKMKNSGVEISLFGHPNWNKQDYNTDKLQALHTRITSSYHVDYKNPGVISFVRHYRRLYSFEPGEYAFKGFDTGFYFGKLLAAHGNDYLKFLTEEEYKGLQNSFVFVKDPRLGYINTSLLLLEYKNYALTPVE